MGSRSNHVDNFILKSFLNEHSNLIFLSKNLEGKANSYVSLTQLDKSLVKNYFKFNENKTICPISIK